MTRQFERFASYLKVADKMINEATKDRVAETAQVLAVELAHYRSIFGEMPDAKVYEVLAIETLTDAQAQELADGCEILIRAMNALNQPGQAIH